MATSRLALRKIRRAREREAPPPSKHFDTYRDEYDQLLRASRTLGGDHAIDSLTTWITSETQKTGRLPHPDAVRQQAIRYCESNGIEVPTDSVLST